MFNLMKEYDKNKLPQIAPASWCVVPMNAPTHRPVYCEATGPAFKKPTACVYTIINYIYFLHIYM